MDSNPELSMARIRRKKDVPGGRKRTVSVKMESAEFAFVILMIVSTLSLLDDFSPAPRKSVLLNLYSWIFQLGPGPGCNFPSASATVSRLASQRMTMVFLDRFNESMDSLAGEGWVV